MFLVRSVFLAALLCGIASAQFVDCHGCHGFITGFGGYSNGVQVFLDNLGATSGSCGDTNQGQCMPVGFCKFDWDMIVLITPGSAGISTVTICPVDSRNHCLGGAATAQAPITQNTNSFVRAYSISCGWKHSQSITDLLGNVVGEVVPVCSTCVLVVIPE